ncbi:PREDICTED: outer dense fiber protein 2-like isoform X2 [Priapulus caudatus]|uniref:Outer dense fiber protein 2-like isoform X2 n=1 Tax=Priapulus caudatus TaxID=37621 RepID=A0ABM1ENW5_PRICU|nr:PREDICTED: outer dense fiber protein 2-like isoform X2 [Priapulus caudatus]
MIKSPVHVHVDDETTVHVHVTNPIKMGYRSGSRLSVDSDHQSKRVRSRSSTSVTTLRSQGDQAPQQSRPTKETSASPRPPAPWVPPPGKTSQGISKYSWKNSSQKPELVQHDATPSHSSMHLSDLSDAAADDLRMEVDDLTDKSKPDRRGRLQQRARSFNDTQPYRTQEGRVNGGENVKDSLTASQTAVKECKSAVFTIQRELTETQRHLEVTESENERLRLSIGKLREDAELIKVTSEPGDIKESLMMKLELVERDSQDVEVEISRLKHLLKKFIQDKELGSNDNLQFLRQKDALLQKITDYNTTNRVLRRLVSEYEQDVKMTEHLQKQRQFLSKRVTDCETEKQRLYDQLAERDAQVVKLTAHIEGSKDERERMYRRNDDLEKMRAHLQKHLRNKEADFDRLTCTFNNLEKSYIDLKEEKLQIANTIETAKLKAINEKEALKKATRNQREKANRSESESGRLSEELARKDRELADAEARTAELNARTGTLESEKAQLTFDLADLKQRISELETSSNGRESQSQAQVEDLAAQLNIAKSDVTKLGLENERLKISLETLEEKKVTLERDISDLRTNLVKKENLLEDYKVKLKDNSRKPELTANEHTEPLLTSTRRDADDKTLQLSFQSQEAGRMQLQGEIELGRVHTEVRSRLEELEPLAEALRVAQVQLQESKNTNADLKKHEQEQNMVIRDLQLKLELSSQNLEQTKGMLKSTEEHSRPQMSRVESLEAKLDKLDTEYRDLKREFAEKSNAVQNLTVTLEARSRDNFCLTQQLEAAMSDARTAGEKARAENATREKNLQKRILNLEKELSSVRAEKLSLRSNTEKVERRMKTQVTELSGKLDTATSKNRTLENYVSFLKVSYASMFKDPAVATSTPVKGLILTRSPLRRTAHLL